MHRHDHEMPESDSLPPRAARVDERDAATLWRAAAAGRTDVVGRDGMLKLQRDVGNNGVQRLVEEESSPVLDVVSSGGGRALDEPVRTDMEHRLGHRFGDVRVHTGDKAHRSAQAVNAHAFTVGSDIVFQRDKYDPASTAGRTMLAHELTHVVQQRNGPVDGTSTGDGVRVSDPSDRFEREASATAEQAMSRPSPLAVSPTQSSENAGTAVQREAVDEEEELQGAFVQREHEQRRTRDAS